VTILSAQSIRKLCVDMAYLDPFTERWAKPLITPFVEAGKVNGKSFGLSACTYDCRSADKIVVPVGQSRLASTMERFCFPSTICGSVLDKSTWARVFLTAFNTHLDPGWEGYLTVELSNLGDEAVEIEPGEPLVQVKFEWLDEPTQLPYSGKYQQQEAGPQQARYD